MGSLIEKSKPYLVMISLQFGYAGMNILNKTSLTRGMSHYVLVVYRHAFATAALAPFAFFLERKARPKLTFFRFCQIFVLGLLGVERVNIKKLRSQAKIVGTIVCVGGALLMTLYEGPMVQMHHQHNKNNDSKINKHWILGSILIVAGTLAWSGLFILQDVVQKTYTADMSLATLICFLGTLQATVIGFALEHDLSKWKLGWDINLLSAVYAGVVTSALAYYLQGVCMRVKGPVFVTAFSPLMMIIVAIMGSIIHSENIYLGSVLGGVMITIGLYAVLWGKLKDSKISADKNSTEMLSISDAEFPAIENKADYIEPASKQLMAKGSRAYQCNEEYTAISITGKNYPEV